MTDGPRDRIYERDCVPSSPYGFAIHHKRYAQMSEKGSVSFGFDTGINSAPFSEGLPTLEDLTVSTWRIKQ